MSRFFVSYRLKTKNEGCNSNPHSFIIYNRFINSYFRLSTCLAVSLSGWIACSLAAYSLALDTWSFWM